MFQTRKGFPVEKLSWAIPMGVWMWVGEAKEGRESHSHRIKPEGCWGRGVSWVGSCLASRWGL